MWRFLSLYLKDLQYDHTKMLKAKRLPDWKKGGDKQYIESKTTILDYQK